ncbi:hypothetical protein niasHT_014309 [Heterodera trifolii]|uniref:Uncharacterized protein n=1 Tax=Heterodera trifolii TaxID=157864 RepID=A0ABD2L7N6_9BILA
MWEHREMEEKEMKYSGGEKKQRQELRVQARQTHNRKRMKNGVTSSKSREHEKVGQRRRAGAGGVRGWQQQRQEINGNRTTMKNRRDRERGREKTEKKRGTNKRDGKRARLAQNSAHVMAKTTGTRTQLAADNKMCVMNSFGNDSRETNFDEIVEEARQSDRAESVTVQTEEKMSEFFCCVLARNVRG